MNQDISQGQEFHGQIVKQRENQNQKTEAELGAQVRDMWEDGQDHGSVEQRENSQTHRQKGIIEWEAGPKKVWYQVNIPGAAFILKRRVIVTQAGTLGQEPS